MSFSVRPSRRPHMTWRIRRSCIFACCAALSAAAVVVPFQNSTARADSTPAPAALDPKAAIEQAKIDAAMNRLREKQQTRLSSPATTPTTAPSHNAPAERSATAGSTTQPVMIGPIDPYSRDLVTARKLQMVQAYDLRLAEARLALRHHQLDPADVRDLINEQSALQHISLDRFRQLLMEVDERNAQRVERYRRFFGDLDGAAKTVVTILMKAGLVDSASKLPDDPLTEDLELTRGVRRVYFTFVMPSREGPPRRHNGYVEFLLAATERELWLPTWADLEGAPIPLFDAQAFFPLRSYRIVYDGQAFMVAQDMETRQTPLFSLLSPPPPPIMDMQFGPTRRRADRNERAWNGVFAAPRLP